MIGRHIFSRIFTSLFVFLPVCNELPFALSLAREGADAPSQSRSSHEAVESSSPARPLHTARPFEPGPALSQINRTNQQYVLAWNKFTTVDDYRRCGRTNDVWNANAIASLDAYSELSAFGRDPAKFQAIERNLSANVASAIKAHCDDPLVLYLHARYVLPRIAGTTPQSEAEALDAAALAIENSGYSPIRKCLVTLRAAEALAMSIGNQKQAPSRLAELKRAAVHHLIEALYDTGMPPTDIAQITREVWAIATSTDSTKRDLDNLLIPTLDKFWSNCAFAQLLIGVRLTDRAWETRGAGFANTVTDAGWRGFEQNLAQAEQRFNKAWALDQSDATISTAMLRVCLGLAQPRPEMEKWFQRAMRINPNNYDAVVGKEYYLEPKWHGSKEAVLAFGRECVQSESWGGTVPLILADIHENLRRYYQIEESKYYSDRDVWQDVRSAYERFFEKNPADVSNRHNYARAAYRSAKYKEFLEQTAKFTSGTNYSSFAGKENFDLMVQKAVSATTGGRE